MLAKRRTGRPSRARSMFTRLRRKVKSEVCYPRLSELKIDRELLAQAFRDVSSL